MHGNFEGYIVRIWILHRTHGVALADPFVSKCRNSGSPPFDRLRVMKSYRTNGAMDVAWMWHAPDTLNVRAESAGQLVTSYVDR